LNKDTGGKKIQSILALIEPDYK